jgi:hypothetical protein
MRLDERDEYLKAFFLLEKKKRGAYRSYHIRLGFGDLG